MLSTFVFEDEPVSLIEVGGAPEGVGALSEEGGGTVCLVEAEGVGASSEEGVGVVCLVEAEGVGALILCTSVGASPWVLALGITDLGLVAPHFEAKSGLI